MALCIICGETFEGNFNDSRDMFCSRCQDLMDYWLNESFTDIKTVAKAQKGKEYTVKDFAEAVEAYGNERWLKEYERSKNRKER